MQRVAITGGGWAYLRALRGDDEESIEGTETASAIALLDRLLVEVPGATYGPGDARRMTAAARDRVLAAIYERELGQRVCSAARCAACGARFDLDFELAAIVASAAPDAGAPGAELDGTFRLPDGTRFRLPTGEDELFAGGEAAPADALVARCIVSGAADRATIAQAIERAAPLIDVELEATCPECGHVHAMQFDIQSFLLGTLLAERRQRSLEIHRLARALGWSLGEILSLTRAQRRLHAELADREVLA